MSAGYLISAGNRGLPAMVPSWNTTWRKEKAGAKIWKRTEIRKITPQTVPKKVEDAA